MKKFNKSSQKRSRGLWLDRNHWAIPIIGAFTTGATLWIWAIFDSRPIVLAAAKSQIRQQMYTSLASSSGSLLGFTVAAVTILAAFGQVKMPDKERQKQEEGLARARSIVSGSLLASAFLLLLSLITSTLLLGLDAGDVAPELWIIVNLSVSTGAIIGLIVGGLGLALAILERNRIQP
jgi:hypothetical protein